MGLGYASECETRIDRINRKLQKLQGKLLEDDSVWLKPKWMRWRTIERICAKLDAADEAWGEEAFARFAPVLLRYSPNRSQG